jgi:hypothetical protein
MSRSLGKSVTRLNSNLIVSAPLVSTRASTGAREDLVSQAWSLLQTGATAFLQSGWCGPKAFGRLPMIAARQASSLPHGPQHERQENGSDTRRLREHPSHAPLNALDGTCLWFL